MARWSIRGSADNPCHPPFDEAVDDLLLAGFFEGHGELVAFGADDRAVAELLVEHAIAGGIAADVRRVGDGDQAAFAFDHLGAARRPAGVAAGLGALPARTVVTGAIALALPARPGLAHPGTAAVVAGLRRRLDVGQRQLIDEAAGQLARPAAIDLPVGD